MTASNPLAHLQLQQKHREALQQALDWLRGVAQPIGVLVSGSIVRGNPGPASDLDIVVLQAAPGRRRVQRWFNGVPVELFFNSEKWLRHCIREEAAQGRPVMAHMLATGVLVEDSDGQMAAVIESARDVLDHGAPLDADALMRDRYAAACQVEDALDFEGADSPDGRQMLALAVAAVARHAYLSKKRFLPRPKERLALLATFEADVARLLSLALSQAPADAAGALKQAAEEVLGTSGFFEWDSGQDSAEPPQPKTD
ncbi:nucleotidyltransferase domain-containing protein [Janthinobacterium sp.]|uniref:nucleotidyltransferase domain-containing protein n=1 Tax=Janthinobacterium sp. TaxID=1871054 RepID=UPI00293D6356|nr:nucleotidyltransferase domain-containing protein [Janthinobacterium sp.]